MLRGRSRQVLRSARVVGLCVHAGCVPVRVLGPCVHAGVCPCVCAGPGVPCEHVRDLREHVRVIIQRCGCTRERVCAGLGVVPEGQRAALWHLDGRVELVEGPRMVRRCVRVALSLSLSIFLSLSSFYVYIFVRVCL